MSTYEPGKLYLIDVNGETKQARFAYASSHGGAFITRGGFVTPEEHATNVRPAIVRDPEDENVKVMVDIWANDRDLSAARSVARLIAAQIAPPAPPEPPMEEPTEWGAKVTDDRGDWIRVEDSTSPWLRREEYDDWSAWSAMENPRPYENPREKPATAPQSDAQGSGSGIGRVSESEAVEGALDLVVYLNETTAAALEELAAKIKAAANEKDSL